MDCVIFDIDGTLSDPTHRLGFLTGPNKCFEGFIRQSINDPVIEPTASILRNLIKRNDVQIIFLTARSSEYVDITCKWLKKHFPELSNGKYNLCMRDRDDKRSDVEVKEEWLEEIINSLPYANDLRLAFEDRDSVIEMYKKYDIFTIKVGTESEFDPWKIYNEEESN